MARARVQPSGGRRPRQCKRSTPTYQFRLDVVRHCEAHGVKAALTLFFPDATGTRRDTKRKSIHLWVKNKAKIEKAGQSSSTSPLRKLRAAGTATVLPAETETELVSWVNAYRSDGAPVSAIMLQLKAQEFAAAVGVNRSVFSGTWAWRAGFPKRHSLRFRARTRQGQKTPEDRAAAVRAMTKMLREKMHELDVDVAYNADQTPVLFEYVPRSTLDKKGARIVWVRTCGKDKERMTCMLLGSSFGEKRTAFLVLKCRPSKVPMTHRENVAARHGFGKQLWKEIKRLQEQHGVQIYANATGWWNAYLFKQWVDYNFKHRQDPSRPILLLLDDFSGHWTDDVLARALALNVHLLPVPAGHTGICQPADIAWNRPLKQGLRQRWVAWLTKKLSGPPESYRRGVKGPTREDAISWVAGAWSELAASTISNGLNGILTELAADKDLEVASNAVAERLESLNLLDPEVGEVDRGADVVDRMLSGGEITV